MKSKSVATLVGMLVLLISVLLAPIASGSEGAEIALEPTPVEVMPGDIFEVTLTIGGVPDPGLAAYDFTITFDPAIIAVDSIEGLQPDFADAMAVNIDNDSGSLSFADVLAAMEGPSGDIALARIIGTAASSASESSSLHFETADIRDPDGVPITATATDGEVSTGSSTTGDVTATPEATASPAATATTTPVATPTPVTTPASEATPNTGNPDGASGSARSTSMNWPLIGGIIGGVLVLAIVLYLLARRRGTT